MKITVLMENTRAREDVLCEHGLSLYIETASHKLLFDMGQSDAFAQNAETLGVDLGLVDTAVLSLYQPFCLRAVLRRGRPLHRSGRVA